MSSTMFQYYVEHIFCAPPKIHTAWFSAMAGIWTSCAVSFPNLYSGVLLQNGQESNDFDCALSSATGSMHDT